MEKREERQGELRLIHDNMLQIAKQMVEIPSINTTEGEYQIGIFLEKIIREIPYFQKHPEQVIVRELKDDSLHRRNVFAVVLGEKNPKADTLLFHGHTDTVGLEGYGSLEKYACKPDELQKHLREVPLPPEVKADLESGEYMFGRGACDMKSGDAVFIGLLQEISEQVEELSGNIVLSLNPVEENLHTGIIEGIDVLLELKEKYKLNYILAINNDFICPLYAGDDVKTIYTGTVGKLLPCFYIQGKETHVGQCYEGFDASIVAAKLADKITLNRTFSDGYEGEYTYPPSVLKLKDLKPWYNVQTAAEAFVYFNYFVHNASMEEITEKLLQAGREVFQDMLDKINREALWFSEKNNQSYCEASYQTTVLTYQELYDMAAKEEAFSEEELQQVLRREMAAGTDKREIPIAMIRYLLQAAKITKPAIVLYYAAPYCPHNTLQKTEAHLIEEIRRIAEKVGQETGTEYRFMKFFPSLSDSSYIKIDDTQESIQLLVDNFPGFAELYPVPLDKIRALNIPAVNYGCYGKDAHKWTERVNIPYTFGVLPVLIRKTVEYYLNAE